jgi:hypothetical protein
LALTAHRGASESGGSCIEVEHPGGIRLMLDVGSPLAAPEGTAGLLPVTLDRKRLATECASILKIAREGHPDA